MTITQWQDVQRALVAHHTVQARDDGSLEIDGETDAVTIRLRDVNGVAWVEITAVLARGAQVPSRPMLEKNFTLASGNLAAARGELMMRQMLPLVDLDPESLHEAVAITAGAARETRAGLGGTAG